MKVRIIYMDRLFFLEEEVDLLEEGDHYFQETCWQK